MGNGQLLLVFQTCLNISGIHTVLGYFAIANRKNTLETRFEESGRVLRHRGLVHAIQEERLQYLVYLATFGVFDVSCYPWSHYGYSAHNEDLEKQFRNRNLVYSRPVVVRSLPLAALPADCGVDCKSVDAAGRFGVVGLMDSEDRSKICRCAIGVPKRTT